MAWQTLHLGAQQGKGNRNGAVVGDAMVQLTIMVVHHGKTISENDIAAG